MNPFTDHPKSVSETYFQHFRFAFCCGTQLILCGLAAIVHAIFPFWFKTTASAKIADLHCKTKDRSPDPEN